jgi:hypothetical protein
MRKHSNSSVDVGIWSLSPPLVLMIALALGVNGKSPLPDEFWTELAKNIQARWIVTVMEYDLTMSGFILVTHLVTSKGEHEVITQANLIIQGLSSLKETKTVFRVQRSEGQLCS